MSNYPIKPAKTTLSVEQQDAQIVSEALSSLETLNEGFTGLRRVTPNGARTVVKRSLVENSEETYSARRHKALTALSHFAVLVQKNKVVEASANNTDLLSVAHPLSTKPHAIAPHQLSIMKSRWYAADPRVSDPLVASLLASAFSAPASSPEYEYAVARLSAMGSSQVPREALVAAFKMGANKGYWIRQLRDGKGRFAFMGGGLRKLVRRANGVVRWLTGKTVSTNPDTSTFIMELPDGKLVRSAANASQSIKAILPGQQTEEGYSKAPAQYSSSDSVTDEDDLEIVESPDGWTKNESWAPDDLDREYYGKNTDLGTAFLEADGNYEVIKFDKPNAPAKDKFEAAQQKESEGQDVVAYGEGKDGELDPNLPVYFLRRNESDSQPFAAVQTWAQVQRLTNEDVDFYENGELPEPSRPITKEASEEAEIPAGTELEEDQIAQLEGDVVKGDPDAPSSKVKAYEKKLAEYEAEGGEFPIDPRKDYFLGDDGTVVDLADGVVVRDSLGNTQDAPEAPEEAPEAEAPETEPETVEEAYTPETAPDGYYEVDRGEYTPEGATEGQESDDYSDDPTELAEEYSAADLTTALKQSAQSNGFGMLPFSDGDELVPAEALYNALKEQGEDADNILDTIYKEGKGDKTPDVTPDVVAELGEDLDSPAQGEPTEKQMPPLIEGLTEDEQQAFLESGNYEQYLEENESYSDAQVPEGYYNIDPDPFTPIDTDVPEGAPEGFSVNPVDIANDYATEDLENELRRSLTPDSSAEGYGVLGMKTPEGEDFVANVPAEAIRDALQLQGVDTKPIIDDVYEQGFKGQDDDEPTPEQIDDALEGEDVEEAETPEETETEEQPAPEAAEPPGPSDPDGDGIATGEPDGPAKVTVAAKDLQPGDVAAADYFTIEEVFSDEESEEKKPGSVWVVGYYPGHQTQKTKLWNANVEVDVYRNVPAPEKGDLPELSKPKPKEFDPEGKIFKDEQLGVFVPKDAEARSKYLDELDQYNKDLATAKGLWSDAPEPGSLGSWQTEEVEAPFTPGDSVGITTVKATEVMPGDIAFKKEYGNDFFEYFIVQGVEEVDGKAVVKGFYPGHESQDKSWNATTEITVMRGATELPEPGNLPALERPAKSDPDFVEKKAAFNAAKQASAENFTPPLNPEEAPEQKKTPKKVRKPSYPAFMGDKLKELAEQADGDPVAFMALLKEQKIVFLDFETTGQGFDAPVPIQVAYNVFENGESVTVGSQFMAPEEPLGKFYTDKDPADILKDPSGNPISDEFLESQQSIEAAISKVADLIDEDTIVVMHNAAFDDEIMERYITQFGLPYNPAGKIDTLSLARKVINGKAGDHKLESVAKRYGLEPKGDWHDAVTDTEVLEPILFNLIGEMGITKQGIDTLDVDANTNEFNQKLEEYNASKKTKDVADSSLVSANLVKAAFDEKDLPDVEEIIAGMPKTLPDSEESTEATTPNKSDTSDGDLEVESVLGDTISNNWVDDDENTTDVGPVPVEDWKPGDLFKAPMGGWFEVQEIVPDPDDENRVFVRRKLLANGEEYGMGKSWVKFKSYELRRRNNVVDEPVVEEAEPQIDTEAKVDNWQGYDIKQDSDGVYYADGISGSDVQKLRNGQLTPPQLPFFAPMGGGNKPDQGDGYFFSANGKRFWGKFGAAGLLLRRPNNEGEYEYFLAKRSSGLSQGGGKWGYPGGAHKNKEDGNFNTANTAIAEFKEEVGGDISDDNANKLGSYDNPVAPDWSYITHLFEVGPGEFNDLQPTDGENSETGWFTAEQISKMAEDGVLQEDFAETADTIFGLLADEADDKEVATPQPNDVTPQGIETVYDVSNWKKVAGQKGTAAGGFYVDPETGQQYYVKSPKGGDMQAVNEVLASAFYEAAGLDVGRAFIGKKKNGDYVVVSPVVDNVDGTLGEMAANQNITDEIKKGFAVDAWMNNYDVIGLEKDNILVSGFKPYRIDAGGALLFRAQGKSKAEEMDTNVSEQIDSLRDADVNPVAAEVFGDMTDAEIAESAKLVERIDESTIDELVDAAFASGLADISSSDIANKLKENLKRRRKELIEQYNVEETPEPEAPESPVEKKVLDTDGDLEEQINDAIANGQNVQFSYNGKDVELSPEEVKTAKNGNVNVVGTLKNGNYYTYNLSKMEQIGTNMSPNAGQTGVFKEYSPDNSLSGAEDTPLPELGFDPEEEITIYRGVPEDAGDDINQGDWVTSSEQLAKDYAGSGGKIISKTVKAKDLLTDPSVGEGAYTEEMVYSPQEEETEESQAGFEPVAEDATPEEVEKPTEVPEDAKQQIIENAENLASLLFGNNDPAAVQEVLETFKNTGKGDPDLIDSVIEDLTTPQESVDTLEAPEEKIAEDIVQATTPADGDDEIPEAEKSEIDPDKLAEELANPIDPDLIWAKVKEDYEASTLDNGHIVVSSTKQGNKRFDVIVKRNPDNTFSIYHRITDEETGDTRVKQMKGRWHSFTALDSRITNEIFKSKALPNVVLSKSKKESAATIQPSVPPKKQEAYVSADGKTIIKVGMTVIDTKTGKKGVVTSLKDEYVVKAGGKTYTYTDAAKVKFEGATKANWKISTFLMPEGAEPPTPDTDDDEGEAPGDGGTPPTPDTPETPTPAAPEPETEEAPEQTAEAATEDEVQLPTYTGPSMAGAETIEQIELNAVDKNSPQHLNAFGTSEYSDYKQVLKGKFVKDQDSNSGKNMAPGILVQNANPDTGEKDLTSYGVVTSTNPDAKSVQVSFLDGPLKGTSQELSAADVWSREKFITPEQAEQLGVELDKAVFNEAKQKAFDKGQEYIKQQKKAAKIAEEKAAKEKAEKEEKAKKAALKAQFTVNGPGFSLQTEDLPEADWSSSPNENVPSLTAALQTAKSDDPLSAANGSTVLIDADKIEDLEVRVQKLTGKGQKEQIRLSFVLTDWAANAATAEFLDNDAIKKSDSIDLDQYERQEDGSLVRKQKWNKSYIDSYGNGSTYSGKVGKGTFKLHRANKSAGTPDFFKHGSSSDSPVSFHNKAEIYLPADATEADIQKALEDFGAIDNVRPASEQDVKGLVENKMIWLYGSETDGTKNFTGDLRQQQLDFIKNNYGFTAEDVEIVVDEAGYGRVNYLIPESAAKKIVDSSDLTHFFHNWTGESLPNGSEAKADYIYKLFASGGLFATANRWMNGINSSGMSSKTDVKAAGGNYVFTHPTNSNSNGSSSGLRFHFDGIKLMRRMDWYKNNSDKYGQLVSDEENNISKLTSGGGEVMFKKNLSWADLSGIDLSSEVRKALIEKLTAEDNVVPNAPQLIKILEEGEN